MNKGKAARKTNCQKGHQANLT